MVVSAVILIAATVAWFARTGNLGVDRITGAVGSSSGVAVEIEQLNNNSNTFSANDTSTWLWTALDGISITGFVPGDIYVFRANAEAVNTANLGMRYETVSISTQWDSNSILDQIYEKSVAAGSDSELLQLSPSFITDVSSSAGSTLQSKRISYSNLITIFDTQTNPNKKYIYFVLYLPGEVGDDSANSIFEGATFEAQNIIFLS